MSLLHCAVAVREPALLHAAAPGDTQTICHETVSEVLTQDWPAQATLGASLCPRCQKAVAVLLQVTDI